MTSVLGLDIGGANTKGCRLRAGSQGSQGASIYHEMWRDPGGLRDVLVRLRALLPGEGREAGVAVTMTAELCDVFPSKAEGVLCVLDQVEDAFRGVPLQVWTIEGRFAPPVRVREEPLKAAASNWLAGAEMLARRLAGAEEGAILLDMGSTTTDILPVAPGRVLAMGRTDTERLAAGELVYTGALRTGLHAVADRVYLDGRPCRTANEYFAISADLYRYLGFISEDGYDVPTPDGAGRGRQECARRLARLAAAEPEALGDDKIRLLAEYLMERQIGQITDGLWQVLSRGDVCAGELVITGEGRFLLELVARRLNRRAVPWRDLFPAAGPDVSMMAFAAAWLLYQVAIES